MGMITRTIFVCDNPSCKKQLDTRMDRLEDYLIKLFPDLESINIYDYIPNNIFCSRKCFSVYINDLINNQE